MSTESELTPLPVITVIPPLVLPAKPRVWTVFLVLFLSLCFTGVVQVMAIVALIVFQSILGKSGAEFAEMAPKLLTSPVIFILFAGCAQVAIFIGTLVPASLSSTPMRERLGLLPVQGALSVYPLAMLGSLVPLAFGFALAYLLTLLVPADLSAAQLINNLTPATAGPFVLFIAVVPGIVEELMFRGYIQRRFLERWRPAVAIGASSVLFALFHVIPHTVLAVLPLGVWLGVVAWKSGSVYPGMLCHAFVNGGLNLWRLIVKFADVPAPIQIAFVSVVMLVSAICFLKLVHDFRKCPGEPSAFLPPELAT
jgi:uncharacterized protein